MDTGSKGSRKLSLYIPQEMLQEMEAEAKRLNRPLSWLVREAWRMARAKVQTFPDRPTLPDSSELRPAAEKPLADAA